MRTAAAILCRRTLQLGLCAAALWIVARTLQLQDSATLVDGSIATGRVTVDGDAVMIAGAEGDVRRVPVKDIARDSHGALRIESGLLCALPGVITAIGGLRAMAAQRPAAQAAVMA
jgi:hypothetical protein